ncbi:hypothetical protein RvY_02935 [Ramazzottius varieornatus]|uniref:Uncharacterized protein n=1 Tax=Ramazzottius varieornatus TaxID=947166 RepID=A0A1D1ULC0_RAMVA|nr:hypothetical protein RvY_02935 [Ramazzottius varieornatus]
MLVSGAAFPRSIPENGTPTTAKGVPKYSRLFLTIFLPVIPTVPQNTTEKADQRPRILARLDNGKPSEDEEEEAGRRR